RRKTLRRLAVCILTLFLFGVLGGSASDLIFRFPLQSATCGSSAVSQSGYWVSCLLTFYGDVSDEALTHPCQPAVHSTHIYEIRPRKDKRGFDLISDAQAQWRFQRVVSALLVHDLSFSSLATAKPSASDN